jgi:pimeloyl-ACP methyl ester carboxylesterase
MRIVPMAVLATFVLFAQVSAAQSAGAQRVLVDRAFHRLEEGLVHVRYVAGDGRTPLVILHPSPSSSRSLEPLLRELALRRPGVLLFAPDTLGNGDSAAPAPESPDADYFAGALLRLLDVMKLGRIDLYGAHTGARIAAEFAVANPARVRRLVLDGIADYPPDVKQQILANYAPSIQPDEYGRQFIWAFNFIRDQQLHFPYFMRRPENRLTNTMASPEELHLRTLDVLKALQTYHKPYLAAFRYPARERLPLIAAPTLFTITASEPPALKAGSRELAALVRDVRVQEVDATPQGKAAAMATFLAVP